MKKDVSSIVKGKRPPVFTGLVEDQLDQVAGGDAPSTPPRDPASGLPTGKRMH